MSENEHVTTPETSSVFPSGLDNDFLLDENIEQETEPVKHDTKLSRRKTDRPRKRKRGSDDSPSVSSILDTLENADKSSGVSDRISVMSTDSVDGTILNLSAGHQSFPNSPEAEMATSLQQIPEDLSLRSDADKRSDSKCDAKDKLCASKPNSILSSSVQELEKAMNRHLPTNKKTFLCDDNDNQSVQSHKSAIHWTGQNCSTTLHPNFTAPFYVSNIYTSRESVIRSSLRSHGLNGESNVINMLTPSSDDVTISKEQLQLHIPHISVNTKHSFHTHKDIISISEEFGMTPPSSVSPQDKITSTFSENVIARDCMGMRTGQRQDSRSVTNKHYSMTSESSSDVTKPHYLSVPSYRYHASDLSTCSQGSVQPSGLVFDPRQSSGNAVWYGSTYNS